MQKDLSKKVVLVTGVSSGIGRATALKLNSLGYKIFGSVRKEEDRVKIEKDSGGKIITFLLDIRYPEEVEKAFKFVKENIAADEEFFALVNNAGIITVSPFELMPEKEIKDLFETNVFGHIRMIQTFIPLLRESKGRIINITSIGGEVPIPLLTTYSATKAAMNAITTGLEIELRKWNIKSIAIEPQPVDTEGWLKNKPRTDEIYKNNEEKVEALYENEFKIIYKSFEKRKWFSIKPELVADTVVKALSSTSPKLKYTVGSQSKILSLLRKILPINIIYKLVNNSGGND